ncbi:MAG: aminopeptidase N [Limisphaerales bacterium]|jgi:aminopeptidase N
MRQDIDFRFITCLILIASLSSCASFLGMNPKALSPKKAGKYPSFTQADSLLGGLNKLRTCYDVRHYNLKLTIEPKTEYLSGEMIMTFDALEEMSALQLDLQPPMLITEAEILGKPVAFSRTHGAYVLTLPHLAVQQGYLLKVKFEGQPKTAKRPPWNGGLVWKKDKNKNPWIGVACEGDGASLWWPLKDHISDEPDSVSLTFHVPEKLVAVSNGRLISQDEGWKWETSYPINPYNVTFYAGDFVHFELPHSDSIHMLDFWVLPENKEIAKSHFEQVAPIIAFFESVFGEYPWWKDGFKLVESPYAGMEHQTAIAYGNGYRNRFGADFDYIILHETAHEWWGNSVSAADFADIWLHEGFATYSEALYVEHISGYDAYLDYLNEYRLFIKNKRPVVGPYGVSHFDYKDSDPYVKGAWVLHGLRTVMGKEKFMELLFEFATQYRQKTVTSTDFIDLAESTYGKDLSWYFKQYLYRRAVPVLRYTVEEGNSEDMLHFRWTDTHSEFKAEIPLLLNGETIRIPVKTELQSMEVERGSSLFFSTSAYYYRILRVDSVKDL